MSLTGVDTKEIECTVIGELWLDERNIYTPTIQEQLFSDIDCRVLIGVLKRYSIRNDIFLLKNKMILDGVQEIDMITNHLMICTSKVVSIACLPEHIGLLQQIQSRNRIIQIIEQSDDKLTTDNIKEIHKLTSPEGIKHYTPKTLKELCLNFPDEYEKRVAVYKDGMPYPTGFNVIDDKIGGILLGGLTLVGGRTSLGKTAIMTNMAVNIANKGVPVLYLSCEMEAFELLDRIIASRTRIESFKIKFAKLQDISRINENFGENDFYLKPLTICYTPGLTLPAIQKLIEDLNPKIIFIDHVQIMRWNTKNTTRAQAIEDGVYELKDLAGEYQKGIVIGSQINREAVNSGKNTKMQPSHYKGSGGLEDAAGVAMEIKIADGEDKENAEWLMDIEVQKARFGPVGTVQLKFQRQYASFVPIL